MYVTCKDTAFFFIPSLKGKKNSCDFAHSVAEDAKRSSSYTSFYSCVAKRCSANCSYLVPGFP